MKGKEMPFTQKLSVFKWNKVITQLFLIVYYFKKAFKGLINT